MSTAFSDLKATSGDGCLTAVTASGFDAKQFGCLTGKSRCILTYTRDHRLLMPWRIVKTFCRFWDWRITLLWRSAYLHTRVQFAFIKIFRDGIEKANSIAGL